MKLDKINETMEVATGNETSLVSGRAYDVGQIENIQETIQGYLHVFIKSS